MDFRNPTRQEHTVLARAFDQWGVFDYMKDAEVFLAEGQPKKVCLLSAGAAMLAQRLGADHAGLVIGELGKGFRPTMAGADLFSRHAFKRQRYISVSDSAEQLVLYGRDVMGDSILSAADSLGENEMVVIQNGRSEAIGIGRTRFPGHLLLQKGKITVTTLADAGGYLRDEG